MIHREGLKISFILFMALLALNLTIYILAGPSSALWTAMAASAALQVFVLRFFRNPRRSAIFEKGVVYAPADGKVVVVEETGENEYLGDRRIQISIFMSVWDVHINWYPVAGTISYYRYHPGKYLVARSPKSSSLNERNTVVLRTLGGEEILIRQIAGAVARRIVSYAAGNKSVKDSDEMGFIRFGSRVDVFLPLSSDIRVKPGDSVKGLASILAVLH